MEIKKLIINNRRIGTIGIADQFLLRLRGLIRRDFSRFDALLIQPCSEIHTMFMAYPIDVLFINKTGKVMKIAENTRPWTLCTRAHKAHSVIEFPAGKAGELMIHEGDQISIC